MSPSPEPRHTSVLPAETLRLLDPRPGETWIDATVGAGGHAKLIAGRLSPGGRLIGLDQDDAMLALARPRLAGLPVELVHGNFDQLPDVLANRNIETVDGLLADLGFCSDQLEDAARGLSFRDDGPLDMRLDRSTGASAAEYVNELSEAALADVLWEYGEERHSRRIARKIVERREVKPFTTTADLAEFVRSCVPRTPDSRPPGTARRGFWAGPGDQRASAPFRQLTIDRLVRTSYLKTYIRLGGEWQRRQPLRPSVSNRRYKCPKN